MFKVRTKCNAGLDVGDFLGGYTRVGSPQTFCPTMECSCPRAWFASARAASQAGAGGPLPVWLRRSPRRPHLSWLPSPFTFASLTFGPLASMVLPQTGDAVGLPPSHLLPVTEGTCSLRGEPGQGSGLGSYSKARPAYSQGAACSSRQDHSKPARLWGRSQGAPCSLQQDTTLDRRELCGHGGEAGLHAGICLGCDFEETMVHSRSAVTALGLVAYFWWLIAIMFLAK